MAKRKPGPTTNGKPSSLKEIRDTAKENFLHNALGDYISARDLHEEFGIWANTARAWRNFAKLRAKKVGTTWFYNRQDLLKLIEMYRRMGSYGGEQIIREEVLQEYTSYQFPELEIRRGLGFDKPLLGERDGTAGDYPCPGVSSSSFGHSGFTGTFVWADPEHEISYVFLSNRVHTTRTNQLLYDLNIRTNILQSVIDSIIEP